MKICSPHRLLCQLLVQTLDGIPNPCLLLKLKPSFSSILMLLDIYKSIIVDQTGSRSRICRVSFLRTQHFVTYFSHMLQTAFILKYSHIGYPENVAIKLQACESSRNFETCRQFTKGKNRCQCRDLMPNIPVTCYKM